MTTFSVIARSEGTKPSPERSGHNFPSLERTAAILGEVSRAWRDPANRDRQEALTALQVSTGFTRNLIEKALAAAFSELTEEKLLAYAASEPGLRTGQAPVRVLHVLAGNVVTSWLPGAVTTLLLGARCDLKPSSREPVFAPLWKRAVERVDPALAEKIRIVEWHDQLLQSYPAVVAYGADQTLAALQAKIQPGTHFIAYGHKLSVAVIWKEALDNRSGLIDRLEEDVAPFQLQGCLSPQVIYVEGEERGIFEALSPRVSVMPVIKRFDSWNELKADLQTFQPALSALGYAGPVSRTAALQSEFDALGFSRVCPIGEMQHPPLTWRNGGFSLVDALTRS